MDDSETRFVRVGLHSDAFDTKFRLAAIDPPRSIAAFPNVQLANGDVLEGVVVVHRAEFASTDFEPIEIALNAIDRETTEALSEFNGAFAGARAARLGARCFGGPTLSDTDATAEMDDNLFGYVAAMARLRVLPPVACAGFEGPEKTKMRIGYCDPVTHSAYDMLLSRQEVWAWNRIGTQTDAFQLALDAALVALVDRAASLGTWLVFSELAKAGVVVVGPATASYNSGDPEQVAYATLPQTSYAEISTGVHIANADERNNKTDDARFLMLFDLCSLRWPDAGGQTTVVSKWKLSSPLAAACLALAARFGSGDALFTKSIADATGAECIQRLALKPPDGTKNSVAIAESGSEHDSEYDSGYDTDDTDDAPGGVVVKAEPVQPSPRQKGGAGAASADEDEEGAVGSGEGGEDLAKVVDTRRKRGGAGAASADEGEGEDGAVTDAEDGEDFDQTINATRKGGGKARAAGADEDEVDEAVSDAKGLDAGKLILDKPRSARSRTQESSTTPAAAAPAAAPAEAPAAAKTTLVFPTRDSEKAAHAYQKSRIPVGKFNNTDDVPVWWADIRNSAEQKARSTEMEGRILKFFESKPDDRTDAGNPFDKTLMAAYQALDAKQSTASTKDASESKVATAKSTKPVWDPGAALELKDAVYWKKPNQDAMSDVLSAMVARLLTFYVDEYRKGKESEIRNLQVALEGAMKSTSEARVKLEAAKKQLNDAKAAAAKAQRRANDLADDLDRVEESRGNGEATDEAVEAAKLGLEEAKAKKEELDTKFAELERGSERKKLTDELNDGLLAESTIVGKMATPVQELVTLREEALKTRLKALVTVDDASSSLSDDEKKASENERALLGQPEKAARIFEAMDIENPKFEGSDSAAILFLALYKSKVPELAEAIGLVHEIRQSDDATKEKLEGPAERVMKLFENDDLLNVRALLYNYVWNLTKQENKRPMWDFSTVILHVTQAAIGQDRLKLARSNKTEKRGVLFYLVQLMIDAATNEDDKQEQLIGLGLLADKIHDALEPLKARGFRRSGGTTMFPAQLLIGEVADAIKSRSENITSLLKLWPKRVEMDKPNVEPDVAAAPPQQPSEGESAFASVAFGSTFSTGAGSPESPPIKPGGAPPPPKPPGPAPPPPKAPPPPPPKPPPPPPKPPPPPPPGGVPPPPKAPEGGGDGGGGGGGGIMSIQDELRRKTEAKDARIKKQQEERKKNAGNGDPSADTVDVFAIAKGEKKAGGEAEEEAPKLPRDQDPAFKIPPLFSGSEAETIQRTLFVANPDPIWAIADDACRALCEVAGFRLPSSLKKVKGGEEHNNPDFAFGMAMLSYALGIAVSQHLSQDQISDEFGILVGFRAQALNKLFPKQSKTEPGRQLLGFFPTQRSALRRSLPDAPVRSLARPMLALRGNGVAFGQSQSQLGIGERMARELRMVQIVETGGACLVPEPGEDAPVSVIALMSGTSPFTKRVLTQQTRFGCDQVGAWLQPDAGESYTDLVEEIVDASAAGDKAVLLVAMLVAKHAFVSVDAES